MGFGDVIGGISGLFDLGTNAAANGWNMLTGAAAASNYNERFGPASNRVNDVGEWAGQYGFDQINQAGSDAYRGFNNYMQNRTPVSQQVQDLYHSSGGIYGTYNENAKKEASYYQDLLANANAGAKDFLKANDERLGAAKDVYGASKENYDFQRQEYQRLVDQGRADVDAIVARGDTALGDVSSRIDDAINSRVSTVGENIKSIASQADQQYQQNVNQLQSEMESGRITEAEFRQRKQELTRQKSMSIGQGQIGLMSQQADQFVADRMNGAKLMADTHTQVMNAEASMRAAVGQREVGAAGNVNTAAGIQQESGKTYLDAYDNYTKGKLAATTFKFEAGAAVGQAMERRHAALTAIQTGEISMMTQSFMHDDQMESALQQVRSNLIRGVAADRANAAGMIYNFVSGARQFEMAGAATMSQLIAGMAINPQNIASMQTAMYNAQQIGGGGGGNQSNDSGGFPWAGVGGLAGMGVGAAMGGGVPGAMMGGAAGSMFGGTAGYFAG